MEAEAIQDNKNKNLSLKDRRDFFAIKSEDFTAVAKVKIMQAYFGFDSLHIKKLISHDGTK